MPQSSGRREHRSQWLLLCWLEREQIRVEALLNMDSVWVPRWLLRLSPQPVSVSSCRNPCKGMFSQSEGSRVEGSLPWKCCLISQQTHRLHTHTAMLTLATQIGSLELLWRKMGNSSGCLCVCLTLWKNRAVSLIELLHICASAFCAAESIIRRRAAWAELLLRPFHLLCGTGQPIEARVVWFSLPKHKL